MDDLGQALSGDAEMLMLGGGNPSHIPEVQTYFRRRMGEILETPGEFERLIGNYDAPQGNEEFLAALAGLLRREFGWPVGAGNIALTPGSQAGFFILFNLFAGSFGGGLHKRVLLPMAPEYIGYADLGLSEDFFTARRPRIAKLEQRLFKYHVDFDAITVGEDIGAICVSRPTNPTGNVLTDIEIARLRALAKAHGIPFIVDSAYGAPFPNILFEPATPSWDDDMILCLSLSKLGLPSARTGIIVAREEIIRAVASVNAILNLANGGFGPALARRLVETGEIIRLSREVIMPYYHARGIEALACVAAEFADLDYYVHKPEGAMFLWLWFPDLPISSAELYQRLKNRGVLVVSGHYFFPGLHEEWRHKQECIRVTYSQAPDLVHRGIGMIADEVKRAYADRTP
jgi:valine--pyruvate aminotransferase